MSEKNQQSKETTEKCRCKNFRCLLSASVFVIVSVCISCIYCRFFIEKDVEPSIHKFICNNIEKVYSQISALKEEISDIKKQIEVIHQSGNQGTTKETIKLRLKWKAWMDLRAKIETESITEEDIAKFNFIFSDDKEILELVKSIVLIETSDEKAKDGKILGMLKKIIKKVDEKKLLEIDGYVLSSEN